MHPEDSLDDVLYAKQPGYDDLIFCLCARLHKVSHAQSLLLDAFFFQRAVKLILSGLHTMLHLPCRSACVRS